ncbi:MAG TPA: class I SAM-dependent methyltransferase [Frankiaceae bacterium]|nr:class I SAM-dependent methyltransferase [Frankiaceae bacterium]
MTGQDGVVTPPREWDAVAYDALPLPHERWGRGVLERLPLRGNERVLDVGAGTGRDTAALLQRLPRGHVVAVDASERMLTRLRARLPAEPRLTVLHADLRAPLPLQVPVDAVFSVATLHWLPDHDGLFHRLADVMRPGALLRAEWGGAGNLANVEAALRSIGLSTIDDTLGFATAGQTARRLRGAGFVDVEVRTVADPARLAPGAQLEAFLGTVVLGAVLDPLPETDRAGVVREVAARLPAPQVDYVRLQASATRVREQPCRLRSTP